MSLLMRRGEGNDMFLKKLFVMPSSSVESAAIVDQPPEAPEDRFFFFGPYARCNAFCSAAAFAATTTCTYGGRVFDEKPQQKFKTNCLFRERGPVL